MIERTLQDGILTLRLAHGKASILDVELLEGLQKEMAAIGDDVRALILTGTGTIFSAGVDLVRLTNEGPAYVRRFLPLLSQTLRTLFALPKPVVAAANGHAIAGGCILVMASDVRLMAEGNGRIGVTELLVGVPFPTTPLEIVRFVTPRDKVQSLIYTGRTLLPMEALTTGIVDEVLPPASLLSRAQEMAKQLAAIPSETYRLTKQSLRGEVLARMDKAIASQEPDILKVWTAEETHATIRGYLQRTLRK